MTDTEDPRDLAARLIEGSPILMREVTSGRITLEQAIKEMAEAITAEWQRQKEAIDDR